MQFARVVGNRKVSFTRYPPRDGIAKGKETEGNGPKHVSH
jgi:hypothetical protein